MEDSYYMDSPRDTLYSTPHLHPAQKVVINARKARVRRANAESTVLTQTYGLSPFQQQLILENERARRQLMLQRDRDEARRRRTIEQNAYGVLGSTANTAGKYFISSLFR